MLVFKLSKEVSLHSEGTHRGRQGVWCSRGLHQVLRLHVHGFFLESLLFFLHYFNRPARRRVSHRKSGGTPPTKVRHSSGGKALQVKENQANRYLLYVLALKTNVG